MTEQKLNNLTTTEPIAVAITLDNCDIFRMIINVKTLGELKALRKYYVRCGIVSAKDFRSLWRLTKKSYVETLDTAIKSRDKATINDIVSMEREAQTVYRLLLGAA